MRTPKHERVSSAYVDRMFEEMQSPENQGSAFTWEKFPTLVKRLVEANLFMHYAKVPANFDATKALAGQHAFEYATELVEYPALHF